MLDPIEITMKAVKTFSDPHYDNAAKNLFLYPEILAPILANVVPEYQGMNAEQVKKLIVKNSIRRDGVDSSSALVAAHANLSDRYQRSLLCRKRPGLTAWSPEVLTENTDYSSLQKVYSIWICRENIPPKLRGTVTSYSVEKSDRYGVSDERKNEYDLLSVILIRLGDDTKKEPIFQYLHDFFLATWMACADTSI